MGFHFDSETMTPEERAMVEAFVRDPQAMRQSARAYFEGLADVVCPCCL